MALGWSGRYKRIMFEMAASLKMEITGKDGYGWIVSAGDLLEYTGRSLAAWEKHQVSCRHEDQAEAEDQMLQVINAWAMPHAAADERLYKVVRSWWPDALCARGRTVRGLDQLTLAEARDWCGSDESSSETATSTAARRRTSRAKCAENPDGKWMDHHTTI